MNKAREKYSESALLLKSVCCVAAVALFVLLFMRHAAPVRTSDKGYGSGVKLLLTENIADVDEFNRWAELNNPSNVFGYNSPGIFTRAVTLKSRVVLPQVRNGMPEEEFLPLPEVPVPAVLAMRMEKSAPRYMLLQPESKNFSGGFSKNGLPVFSDKGELLCTLKEFSGAAGGRPLLVNAERSGLGTRFRIVESSGDRNFDTYVTAGLEEKIRSGSRFSGMLAVWPKGEKKQ